MSLVLGFAIILMAIASLLGYRHYRLEAEINSMTWKINWNDILPCNPASKHRGSLHSLAKRGSQLVWKFHLFIAVFSYIIRVVERSSSNKNYF